MEISYLELEIKVLNSKLIKVRKTLKTEQENDETKIKFLSSVCYEIVQYLGKLNRKGEHILNISSICRKYVTEREKLSSYLPIKSNETDEQDTALNDEFRNQQLNQDQKGMYRFKISL